jgi:hypothetical protein
LDTARNVSPETFLPKSSHRNVPANKVPVKNALDTKMVLEKGSWRKDSCKKVPTKNIPGRIKLLWQKAPESKRFLTKKAKVPDEKRFPPAEDITMKKFDIKRPQKTYTGALLPGALFAGTLFSGAFRWEPFGRNFVGVPRRTW